MDVAKPVQDIRITRWRSVCESLNSKRTADECDVTLTCADREFYVHKCVIEASCPYFETMLNCGLEESRTRNVVFHGMDPEALDMILDFLYLGVVQRIKTQQELKKVLEVAHFMQLHQLTEYCYDHLSELLSVNNFVEIWNIANKFGSPAVVKKVINFMVVSVSEILNSPSLHSLSLEQLEIFFAIESEMVNFSNEFLAAAVVWLRVDLEEREKYTKELLESFSTHHLSEGAVKLLLEDEELANSSEEIANGLREIQLAIKNVNMPAGIAAASPLEMLMNSTLGQVRIVFYSEYQAYRKPNQHLATFRLVNSVQELNIATMTWLPPIMVPVKVPVSIFATNECFAPQDSLAKTMTCKYGIESRIFQFHWVGNHPTMFVKCFSRFGGPGYWWRGIGQTNAIHYLTSVLLTSKYLFLIGTSNSSDALLIEFNLTLDFKESDWHVVPTAFIPEGVKTHFFVYQDCLCGFYYTKGELVRILFDPKTFKWSSKVLPVGPPGITGVSSIYRDLPGQCIIFVSISPPPLFLPNFIWNPETGKWTRLPLPKGNFELEANDDLKKLYRASNLELDVD